MDDCLFRMKIFMNVPILLLIRSGEESDGIKADFVIQASDPLPDEYPFTGG